MTEQFDDDEAVQVATSLEQAAGALDEGSAAVEAEVLEGIQRYARHVITVLNAATDLDPETDMAELLITTITNIGAACWVLGSFLAEQNEDPDTQWLPVDLPAGAVIAALRGGSINLRLNIE